MIRNQQPPTECRVQTQQGLLDGFSERDVYKFFGIPFAAPPVGELRWRPTAPPSPWHGVRDAKRFGAACVQTIGAAFDMRTGEQSEDCLYLNVWTQTLDKASRQPVMVWIHGGGNLGGAGSEDAFDGSRLAMKGVTAVTFNYRLGAFGFLAHPDLGANFGVLDYVAALQWVRTNIAAFGGNAENVTVFGESAGAVAVRTLLSCPSAFGLFHRAIIQSAGFERPAFAKSWSYERAKTAAEALFHRLGTQDINALRKMPTADLKIASHELSGIFPAPGTVHTPANLVWMPVVDGKIVVDGYPGWPENVPVMLGCLENEARYFIKPSGSYTWEIVRNMARALCGPKADQVMAIFDRENLSPYEALDKLFTAVIWTEPALETARKFATLGRTLFYYHFNRLSPGAIATRDLAKHSAEIRYVFGNLTDDGAYDEVDRQVSDLVQSAWISFARNGVPESSAGTIWPRYRLSAPHVAWIEDTISVRAFPVTEVMSALNSLRQPT
jgi:para-nitrobenzyl esterase